MSIRRNHLLVGALTLGLLGSVAPSVLAQPMTPPGPERSFNRHMDGRVAFLKAELKITPAQQTAFEAYARVLRQNADEMDGAMKKRRDQRAGDAMQPTTAIQQLERRAEMAKLVAAQSQRSLDAFKTLYAQLSDEQKKAADELLSRRGGRGGPHHRRT